MVNSQRKKKRKEKSFIPCAQSEYPLRVGEISTFDRVNRVLSDGSSSDECACFLFMRKPCLDKWMNKLQAISKLCVEHELAVRPS